MDEWAKIYQWEASLLSGRKVYQAQEDIDMLSLVAKYGLVHTLTLVPRRQGFPVVSVPIPEGTHPVYFRRRSGGFDEGATFCQTGLAFHIGWEIDGHQVMNAVDAYSGHVRLVVE